MKRKTSSKKFRSSLKRVSEWIQQNRTLPLTILMNKMKQKLYGYYRYYGITDNSYEISNFRHLVRKLLYKWLNRRSQKRSYNWRSFNIMFDFFNIPKAKIYVSIFELKDAITYIL